MKLKAFATVTVITFLVVLCSFLPSTANSQSKSFYCGSYTRPDQSKVPATIAVSPRGTMIPLFIWSSKWAASAGWTPQKRCVEVSARFRNSYANGSLRFIRTGMVNGLKVICAASYRGGACPRQNVLITLRPGNNQESAEGILKDFTDLRRKVGAGGKPLEFSANLLSYNSSDLYLDVTNYFKYIDEVQITDIPIRKPTDENPGDVFYR